MSSSIVVTYHHIDQTKHTFQLVTDFHGKNLPLALLTHLQTNYRFPSKIYPIHFLLNHQFPLNWSNFLTGFPQPVLDQKGWDIQGLVGCRGGKGGFGSMLRAQGGRMNSKKTTNTDMCRDLQGRRLKTKKKAKQLKTFLDGEVERKQQLKTQKLNKIARRRKLKVHRTKFDDVQYLNQTEQLKQKVKLATLASLHSLNQPGNSNPPKSKFVDQEVSSSEEEPQESFQQEEDSEELDGEEEEEEEDDDDSVEEDDDDDDDSEEEDDDDSEEEDDDMDSEDEGPSLDPRVTIPV